MPTIEIVKRINKPKKTIDGKYPSNVEGKIVMVIPIDGSLEKPECFYFSGDGTAFFKIPTELVVSIDSTIKDFEDEIQSKENLIDELYYDLGCQL